MRSYPMDVVGYTRGRGHLNLSLDGYRPCHNAEEVIAAVGYEPEHDLDNPADSVFCAHGAGFVVPWEQVRSHMHVDSGWGKTARPAEEAAQNRPRRMAAYRATLEEDAELLKIFEQTYGPIKRDPLAAFRPTQKTERPDFNAEQWEIAPEYLLVDGYNIIFAWDELNELSKQSLEAARKKLMDILCNYQGFKKCLLILVFDAYRVPGSPGTIQQYTISMWSTPRKPRRRICSSSMSPTRSARAAGSASPPRTAWNRSSSSAMVLSASPPACSIRKCRRQRKRSGNIYREKHKPLRHR